MKKLTLGFLLLVISFASYSQKVYFIYLQTEGEQPFFVRINDKVSSSSASGYLILSKLRDTTYDFSIGFPQNKWPERNFSVAVNKKDHGYLVKNFGEKGWGLFDLQTLAIQMPVAASGNEEEKTKQENGNVSPFTEILSKASNDPSLKEKPVEPVQIEKKPDTVKAGNEKKEEPKAETIITPVVIKDDQQKNNAEVIQEKKAETKMEVKEEVVQKDTLSHEEVYKQSVVTRKSESSTTEGFGLVFIDQISNEASDTIRLLIPNPKPIVVVPVQKPVEEKKFLDITTDSVKAEMPDTIQKMTTEPAAEIKPEKKNCPEQATESDFFTLRKIMAGVAGDDEMVAEAKKYFKAKCFTTDQIRNLSFLFLNDAGKYKFFDVAYEYVTDAGNFPSLQKELKEEYYINRFKAMLRN